MLGAAAGVGRRVLSIIIGYRQETPETIDDTSEVLKQGRVYPSVGFVQLMPGTPMYQLARTSATSRTRKISRRFDHPAPSFVMAYDSVLVGHLGWANALRILASPELRRARAIYCKHEGPLGRLVFGARLRRIPDHYSAPVNDTNFADARAFAIAQLTGGFFQDERDRYLKRFLQQAMAESIFESVILFKDHTIMPPEPLGRSCILAPVTPFLPELRRRYQTGGREIRWGFGRGRIRRAARQVFSQGARILGSLVTAAGSGGAGTEQPPALSVLSSRGNHTWDDRHDFAWLKPPHASHPIIFEYAQPLYALSLAYVEALRARGIRVVQTHRKRGRVPGAEVWRPGRLFARLSLRSLAVFAKAFTAGAAARDAMRVWRAVRRLQFELAFNERADYYRTYNVKAEFIAGFTRLEPAHSGALAACGGISSVAQHTTWIDHFASHTSTSTFHLHFGAAIGLWNLPFLADYSVLNGYLFKTALVGNNPTVSRMTQQFETAGVRRSVCFLDEGLDYEDLAADTLTFYEYLLRKVVADPLFGLIIKPKKDDTIDILRGRFAGLLTAAEQSGRIIVLDRRHYPGHAARCVDLTVGILGTAPFECAIAGCRAIYFSPFGYVPPFMADIGHNVFGDAPEVIAAIERFFDSPADTAIGAHSERFLRSIDHYRDAETADRIQYLMTTYLSEIGNGRTREHAIAATIAGFSSRWTLCTADGPAIH